MASRSGHDDGAAAHAAAAHAHTGRHTTRSSYTVRYIPTRFTPLCSGVRVPRVCACESGYLRNEPQRTNASQRFCGINKIKTVYMYITGMLHTSHSGSSALTPLRRQTERVTGRSRVLSLSVQRERFGTTRIGLRSVCASLFGLCSLTYSLTVHT